MTMNTWGITGAVKDPGKKIRRFCITSEFERRFYFIDDEMVEYEDLSDRDQKAFDFLRYWAESRHG